MSSSSWEKAGGHRVGADMAWTLVQRVPQLPVSILFSPSFLFFFLPSLPPHSLSILFPCLGIGFISSTEKLYWVPRWPIFGSVETPWPQAFGASPFCSGVLSPSSYPARFSFPLCVLQAAQPFRNPSEKLPRSPLCLSSDQVLRILAKNEKQLSLLRDLEGLKPQKVRNLRGLGPSPLLPHSGLYPRFPVPFPPPQTWPSGCACWRWQHWGRIKRGSSSGEAGNTGPRRWDSPSWLSPLPCKGGMLWKRWKVLKSHERCMSLWMGCHAAHMGHICFPTEMA